MARKVFISVLGTGFYQPCVYGDTGVTTHFIQEATLLNVKAKEWSNDDTGIVLLTNLARTTNWEVAGNKRQDGNKNVVDYCGLKQRIEAMALPFAVRDVPIPDGKNEEEMWTIFTTLFDELDKGDELYIDLTHAFRYLPMLVLVLTNYAKFLKEVTVKSLTYGNWEARDDENHAPIVDLLPIAAIQDWTYATAEYLNSGFAKNIKDLTETTLKPLMKVSRTANLESIRRFSSSIEKLSNERIMCRGKGIIDGKNVASLKNAARQIEKMTIAPLKPVMDRIISSVNSVGNTDIKRCIDAARWCYEKRLYQQAITILQEGIVTFFCERHNLDLSDERSRKLVNVAFDRMVNTRPLRGDYTEGDINIINNIMKDDFFSNKDLINLFSAVTDLRNDYNHAGFRPKGNTFKVKTMTNNIERFIETAARIFT